ncbi:MAG: flagellar biosynthetic protein FliR [Ilumatobacteraceae bacterium]|nr:flagellar biosynthetic protein FliR [Ilumatobacteraceae bacterium]
MQILVQPTVLVGFCLMLVRSGAWVSICPPFNMPAIPGRIRAGFAVAMSLVLASKVGAQVESISTVSLVGAMFTQLLAGFALGFFVFVIFSVIQSAGELIDLQVGFSLGGVIDPLSGNNSTPIGRFHQLLGLAIMFAINGHVIVTRAFIRSVEVAPMGQLDTAHLAQSLAKLVAVLLAASLEIALPVLTALFCTEVALGFLGKAAPQLNILVIGFALKAMIAFALLGATLVLLPEGVESLLGRGLRAAFDVFGH